MLKYYSFNTVFQEIPDEVSLCFEITGCPLRCPGCHSPHLRNPKLGTPLTENSLGDLIEKNIDLITCILFMGGEWEEEELIKHLHFIQSNFGLKTALYTGAEDVSPSIKKHLNYLKTGPYIEEYGPLNTETTNQVLLNLDTGESICLYPSETNN